MRLRICHGVVSYMFCNSVRMDLFSIFQAASFFVCFASLSLLGGLSSLGVIIRDTEEMAIVPLPQMIAQLSWH